MNISLEKNKIKTVRVLFPLYKDTLTAYLSPILGQYAIKNSEFILQFIEAFHKSTAGLFKPFFNTEGVEIGNVSLYEEVDLSVPLILKIFKGGKFLILIKNPPLGFLFSNYFKKRRRIYRRFSRLGFALLPLRNYKKLFQLCLFQMFSNSSTPLLDTSGLRKNLLNYYKESRNAVYQRK